MKALKLLLFDYDNFVSDVENLADQETMFLNWTKTEKAIALFKQVGIDPETFGKTPDGHETKKLVVVPGYEDMVKETDWNVTYLRVEYDHQIEKMKRLGIRVNDQLFEQCVNTLFMIINSQMNDLSYLTDRVTASEKLIAWIGPGQLKNAEPYENWKKIVDAEPETLKD